MIYMFLADGFEEVEALTPLDLLRRAGAEIATVGIQGNTATGSHGITVACDITADEMDLSAADMLILPGGMPGSKNLDACEYVDRAIAEVHEKGGRLAAICAAPFILGRRGLLVGKHAVCYPGFEGELIGCNLYDGGVITDGNITTAKSMGYALDFSRELLTLTVGKEKSESIIASLYGKE